MEERLQPYVLAIPKNQRIGLTHRAEEVVIRWSEFAWQAPVEGGRQSRPRLSCNTQSFSEEG